MEAFQTKLDALQKESKDLITQAMQGLTTAALTGAVPPTRLAMTLAQRFTADRMTTSFPALCLVDAMVLRAAAPPTPGDRETAVMKAVLAEFWTVAPTLFTAYATQPAVKDKSMRVVRRWKQRKALPDPLVDELLSAMETGPKVATAEPSGTDPAARRGGDLQGPRAQPANPDEFTTAQLQAFRSTLQSCTTMLEKMPPERSRLYTEAIRAERFTGPSKAAFAFLQALQAELRRELMVDGSGGGTRGEAASKPATSATEEDPERSADARAALGRLLDTLSHGSSGGGGSGGAGDGSSDGGAGVAGGGASHALRYTSPLFSDIYQRQSLTQRAGFGQLHKRKAMAGTAAQYYYPRREATAARPFRVPAAKQLHGGAVRRWFPSPQQWVSEKDMANLALFEGRGDSQAERETSSLFSVARKRERAE